MTVTTPPSRLANLARGWRALRFVRPSFRVGGSIGVSGLFPAALLALAPKCALCVLAYAGLGTVLGLTGPELCGAPTGTATHWVLLFPALGIALGLFTLYRRRACAGASL